MTEEIKGIIYRITCIITNKCYIGQTRTKYGKNNWNEKIRITIGGKNYNTSDSYNYTINYLKNIKLLNKITLNQFLQDTQTAGNS